MTVGSQGALGRAMAAPAQRHVDPLRGRLPDRDDVVSLDSIESSRRLHSGLT